MSAWGVRGTKTDYAAAAYVSCWRVGRAHRAGEWPWHGRCASPALPRGPCRAHGRLPGVARGAVRLAAVFKCRATLTLMLFN